MDTKNDYFELAHGIAKYLGDNQTVEGSFPARTFYGETFSALLWSYFGSEFGENIKAGIDYYDKIDKSHRDFHWEFNNYALLRYFEKTKDDSVSLYLKSMRFTGTRVTNWTLLRAVDRILSGKRADRIKAQIEINACLLFRRDGNMLVDEKDVRSFQYHCFSAALLGEICEATGGWYRKDFLSAVDFITEFIMPNGDAIYVGRGQEQIFGYAALLYLLEYAHRLTGNAGYKACARRVLSHIIRFRRVDGSFPLVLRDGEAGYPSTIDVKDTDFLGWYSYNNYFDYLPFAGYYLMRAYESTVESGETTQPNDMNGIFSDKNFYTFSNEKYKAVISRSSGRWSNDLPLPYVCFKGESIFPCYGGEQNKSFYSEEQIPLPFWEKDGKKTYIRSINCTLKNNSLFWHSDDLDFKRAFSFKEDGFVIEDELKIKRKMQLDSFYPVNLFFFEIKKEGESSYEVGCKGAQAKLALSSHCFIDSGEFYCARGKMTALREKIQNTHLSKDTVIKRGFEFSFDV